MIDVRTFTVGPIQENAYLVRATAQATRAVMVDPGEEPQRLLDAVEALGVEIEAILITHCHFDHVGAVAPLARATAAPVYCPEIELGILADLVKWTMPGFGPYESWDAEQTVKGGECLSLAGLDIQVIFTPGHSPGHVTYAIAPAGSLAISDAQFDARATLTPGSGGDARVGGRGAVVAGGGGDADTVPVSFPALLSGDVLFQGSVGRVDLPGGDWRTLERSIGTLMAGFPRETLVYPGHMGLTTLGGEWDSNPFLSELRSSAASTAPLPTRGS